MLEANERELRIDTVLWRRGLSSLLINCLIDSLNEVNFVI